VTEIRIPVPRIPAGLGSNLTGLAGLIAVVVAIGMLAGLAWAVMAAGLIAVGLAVVAQLGQRAAAAAPTRRLEAVPREAVKAA
jgi:hypothetical protein